jgi:hypothetical protein
MILLLVDGDACQKIQGVARHHCSDHRTPEKLVLVARERHHAESIADTEQRAAIIWLRQIFLWRGLSCCVDGRVDASCCKLELGWWR